jgi:long-chain acyl-CoA synthetase
LVADVGELKPNFFPSVPRLYNKIYSALNAKFAEATGCKAWLVQKGLAAKRANQLRDGRYTHGCYDKLIFKKAKAMLGG